MRFTADVGQTIGLMFVIGLIVFIGYEIVEAFNSILVVGEWG